MDNKLSELSKPVAWEVKGILCHSEEEAQVYVGEPEPLYSQECVLALLAELEASKKSNAFLKEQLSQLANFNPDWDMLEACRESWREVSAALKEAEKRLATPVRLPDIRSDDYHETGWFQHMKYYRDVERSLRAAGFTVGDE
ncbi:hypothetical protein [Serratia sp. BW106]|uniref:hypothetical protein n=1 Tax=Serratia sp. BW106 TaxID=1884636 RepID=UPI000BFF8189|nr:hypothetical protein [Serratia sp. BW106]